MQICVYSFCTSIKLPTLKVVLRCEQSNHLLVSACIFSSIMSGVDLLLISMFSSGRSEGDRDEGSKKLIERRDKVDIEQSVCVCAQL